MTKYQYTYFIYPYLIEKDKYKKYLQGLLRNKKCKIRFFDKQKDIHLYTYFLPCVREYMFWSFDLSKNGIKDFNSMDTSMQSTLLAQHECNIFNYELPEALQGKALYSKIEDVVSASNALYAAVAEINEQTPQQIKIGAFSSISRTILPGVLSKFKQMYPNIAVDVIVGGRDLDRRLLNGEVQLAFMDAYGAQGFDWIPLFSSPLVAVLPKDDDRDTDKPVDIHELFGECVSFCAEMCYNESLRSIRRQQ